MSDLILLVHVLAAATWWGGHVYIEGLLGAASRSGDQSRVVSTMAQVGTVSGRLFPIAGTLVLLSGIFIVIDKAWTFEMLFVAIGFAAAVFGMAYGLFYLSPAEKELVAIVEEHGADSQEGAQQAKKVGAANHVMALVVTVAIVSMVLKFGA